MIRTLALAADGLARKKGRAFLTMLGVIIGVFALAMIVGLGQGISSLLTRMLSTEDNLRTIEVAAGTGQPPPSERMAALRIDGEMSAERRDRLRRAAVIRTRPRGPHANDRMVLLDDAALATIAAMPHVESLRPVISERYAVTMDGRLRGPGVLSSAAGATASASRRLVAGAWFSDDRADEVVVHEYALYQWGYVTEAEQAAVIGQTLMVEPARNGGLGANAELMAGAAMMQFGGQLDDKDRDDLARILGKVARGEAGPPRDGEPPPPHVARSLRIVGVVRGLSTGDPFNALEDGPGGAVDLFLPQQTAQEMYRATPGWRARGYDRVTLKVDNATHATEVESALREAGYTAIGVGTIIDNMTNAMTGLTMLISMLTAIALLVAALGIMNTMITSVLERTREIGLWKALGATDLQVRSVFLAEAALIGLIGGLTGLGLALLMMVPVGALASDWITRESGMPFSGPVFDLPAWLMIAAPLMAAGVAMLAAFWPSSRAARIDPVRALRHE
ncbi:MAG: ABC transporter permease [Planctomycetota bacterium]